MERERAGFGSTLQRVHASHRDRGDGPRRFLLPVSSLYWNETEKTGKLQSGEKPRVIDPTFTFSCPFVSILDFPPNWAVTATFPD